VFWKSISSSMELLYRLMRVNLQIVYGAFRIAKLPQPIVTIFGGARVTRDNPYAHQAQTLAHMLVEQDISVLTGGGPGIMEAASCGALRQKKGKGQSMGIGVKDLGQKPNQCVKDYFELDYFFARKWLLTRYAVGFVFFPGGFGTFDELHDIVCLIKTNMLPRVPVILYGVSYWKPYIDWITDTSLQQGLIEQKDLELIILTDDLERILHLLCQRCNLPPLKNGERHD
jgi:uncharacterized protein (TIGR00730 family)